MSPFHGSLKFRNDKTSWLWKNFTRREVVEYRWNRLDEPVFMAVPKPMRTEFGIHQRLESCIRESNLKHWLLWDIIGAILISLISWHSQNPCWSHFIVCTIRLTRLNNLLMFAQNTKWISSVPLTNASYPNHFMRLTTRKIQVSNKESRVRLKEIWKICRFVPI